MVKYQSGLGSLNSVLSLVYEKESYDFKPVKLCFEIEIVSHIGVWADRVRVRVR